MASLAFAAIMLTSLTAAAEVRDGDSYDKFPTLRGPLLGQPPPGESAEVFAPGVLRPSTGYHSSVVFSPDGQEACWTAMASGITYMSRLTDGSWSRPRAVDWDVEFGVREPFYSRDGNRVYFLSRRPPPGESSERERIWFVDRKASGWSAPQPIGALISDHPTHWQFSLNHAGDLYFTSEAEGVRGEQDIYVAKATPPGFEAPRDVGPAINTSLREFCPFIAPDDSYLLFARPVPEHRGRSDLFVSFPTPDGNWSEARNLGPSVNTPHNEVSPVVTPDNRYLVFLRVSGDINDVYWISTQVIERLRPE